MSEPLPDEFIPADHHYLGDDERTCVDCGRESLYTTSAGEQATVLLCKICASFERPDHMERASLAMCHDCFAPTAWRDRRNGMYTCWRCFEMFTPGGRNEWDPERARQIRQKLGWDDE